MTLQLPTMSILEASSRTWILDADKRHTSTSHNRERNTMKTVLLILTVAILCVSVQSIASAQTYAGSQACQTCHSNASIGGLQYTNWQNTLHTKIHQRPDTVSMRTVPSFQNGDSISMGSSYGNAKVFLSKTGNDYFARLGAGGPNYKIAYTYGWGYKQRYLVKIDTSYYILPIQWNLKGYLDNSTGGWVTYNPNTWFKANGEVIRKDSLYFRKKSWDKNCMGCHLTGGKVSTVVAGADTQWVASWANGNSDLNITVGCEACHGPSTGGAGQGHQMNPTKLMSKQSKMEVCGQCHNRGTSYTGNTSAVGTHEYGKNEVNNTYFNPADTTKRINQFYNFNIAPNATGGRGTWVDTSVPRQHHQQYHDMIGSAHYTNPFVEVTCFTCHVSHRPTPNGKLVVDSLTVGTDRFRVSNEDNTLCLACHATFGPFASVQKAWVRNPVAFKDSIGRYVNRHTKHNLYDPTNAFNSGGGGRCTKCHMTQTATTAKAFDISVHSWGVISPNQTRRYSTVGTPSLGMINTCAASCHRNPSGPTAIVPAFGVGTDANISDWREVTDLALADTLWRYWQSWGFTGVKEVAGNTPGEYSLSQNYPNPFNPSTKINVDISKRSAVKLIVYNVIGQEIVTLMGGDFNAGKYEVTWNGKDGWGQSVASGMYLYRLEVGDFAATKKMILMK